MTVRKSRPWPFLLLGLAALLLGCGVSSDSNTPAEDSSARETVRRIPNAPHAALAFSPDGKTLAAASHDSLHLYDLVSGWEHTRIELKSEGEGRYRHLAFSPDGRHLASAHMGSLIDHPWCSIYLWEVTGDNQLRKARTLFAPKPARPDTLTTAFHVAFSPDGKTVIAGRADGTVYLWETATGKERLRIPGGTAAAFSADGKTVLAVSHDGAVSRWDAATGKVVHPAPQTGRKDFIRVAEAAFAPGAGIMAVHDDYMISLRELATGRQVRRLMLPQGICCPALSPDGRVLAVEGDGGIHFFNGTTGEERGWRKGQAAIAFSADSNHIAFAEDGVVVVREVADVLADLGKPPPPTLTDPPDMPLEAELIVNQDTYALDLGSRSPEEFSRHIIADGRPPRPKVDLVFRLRNTGDQKLTMSTYGKPGLFLTGEGVLNLNYPCQTGVIDGGGPGRVTLVPGESYSFPVKEVALELGGESYWLLPGVYTVHARYSTFVAPAPKGASPERDGSAYVTIRSAPIKLRVVGAR